MSKIAIEIFPDAEQWLRENLPDIMTDSIAVVYPVEVVDANQLIYKYHDAEEDKYITAYKDSHVKALQLLCEQIGRTLFVGMVMSPYQLLDSGNWDIEVADAYYQLVFHGEVIYG